MQFRKERTMTRVEILKIYDGLADSCPRFDRKGKTMPYTSANGYMFSLVNKENQLGIRFSKEVQKKYMEKFETTIFKSYNAVMKGYILIPEKLLADSEHMVQLLNESYDYVMSLESK